LDSSPLREDADPLLFPAHWYGKGDIPKSVKSFLHEVQTTSLVSRDCTRVSKYIPPSVFSLRIKLKKQKGNWDLERHLEDERLHGRRFLYYGLSS
jgi:hypothetical protein